MFQVVTQQRPFRRPPQSNRQSQIKGVSKKVFKRKGEFWYVYNCSFVSCTCGKMMNEEAKAGIQKDRCGKGMKV